MATYTSSFVLDPKGNEALLAALASGLDEFAGVVAEGVRAAAPKGVRGTPRPLRTTSGGVYIFYGRPGKGNTAPYRRTIHHATYLNGKLFAGTAVRGENRSTKTLRAVVYTTSFTGHLLEFGSARHEIAVGRVSRTGPFATRATQAIHPGSRRYPHFWPGLVSSLPEATAAMARRGVMASKFTARVTTRLL